MPMISGFTRSQPTPGTQTLGLLAVIGAKKGRPFAQGDRMKKSPSDATAVGNAFARSIVSLGTDKSAYQYDSGYPEGNDSHWIQIVPGNGFNVILRFYGAPQSRFDQNWWWGDIEPME